VPPFILGAAVVGFFMRMFGSVLYLKPRVTLFRELPWYFVGYHGSFTMGVQHASLGRGEYDGFEDGVRIEVSRFLCMYVVKDFGEK